jgi:hypothetical protein
MTTQKSKQELGQMHYARMHLQANTLVRGAEFISEVDVGRMIENIIDEANMLVNLTPPDDVPHDELQSFANGLAVEEIMNAVKNFKEGNANDALDIFYKKCSNGLASNPLARSAFAEVLGGLSGKDNMFEAMKYAEDVDILTRMLKQA